MMLILGLLVVLVGVVVLIVLVAKRKSAERNSPDAQRRRAYEDGRRHAELQKAYDAGLKGEQPPAPGA